MTESQKWYASPEHVRKVKEAIFAACKSAATLQQIEAAVVVDDVTIAPQVVRFHLKDLVEHNLVNRAGDTHYINALTVNVFSELPAAR